MEQKGPCRDTASKPLSVHETLCHREGRTRGRESAALGRGPVSFVNRCFSKLRSGLQDPGRMHLPLLPGVLDFAIAQMKSRDEGRAFTKTFKTSEGFTHLAVMSGERLRASPLRGARWLPGDRASQTRLASSPGE